MHHAQNQKIRVLVVDDSAYIRKVVSAMLNSSSQIEVVGTARNGIDALEKTAVLKPDVVTLDLIMPEMDGVGYLKQQMAKQPLPVVVVSIASMEGRLAMDAMEAGALDFVQKPTALAVDAVHEITNDLVSKVIAAAGVPLGKLPDANPFSPSPVHQESLTLQIGPVDAVVLGISTGGPQALRQIIPRLPGDFSLPIAIVLHMPEGYTGPFANRLNDISALTVVEARDGDVMLPGQVLLAPAGQHLFLKRDPQQGQVIAALSSHPQDLLHRPSVDVLFQSAAEVYEEKLLGVVMTGLGNDAKTGAAWIKAKGGTIITESEESCVVYGMPRSIVEAGLSDYSLHRDQMVNALLAAAN